MLSQLRIEDLDGGFNVVDIGASGEPDRKWRQIARLMNLIGFEPNAVECERLNGMPHAFNSARYLPYALAGQGGSAEIYETRHFMCWSLLPPNTEWLKRFTLGSYFDVMGKSTITVRRLDEVPELTGFDADVIKVDSQGLDRAILEGSGSLLDRAFYVETEPGFVENYVGENTYSQVEEFLRGRDFLLFEMNTFHVPRENPVGRLTPERGELLWCENVWLRDWVALELKGSMPEITRGKALKALALCALEGSPDYGYELAEMFERKGLLRADELAALRDPDSWRLVVEPPAAKSALDTLLRPLNWTLRLLPGGLRKKIAEEATRSVNERHLIKAMIGR